MRSLSLKLNNWSKKLIHMPGEATDFLGHDGFHGFKIRQLQKHQDEHASVLERDNPLSQAFLQLILQPKLDINSQLNKHKLNNRRQYQIIAPDTSFISCKHLLLPCHHKQVPSNDFLASFSFLLSGIYKVFRHSCTF